MRLPDARLLIFARAPRPGRVKTRLIPRLGDQGAADLHATLVRRTLHTATRAALCPIELWCDPVIDDPFFTSCKRDFPVTLHLQQGVDLGARMHHALADALTRSRAAVLTGSDCPALTPDRLTEAMEALIQKRTDVIFTPAEDGGYVLVGMRRVAPGLFDEIDWGSARVMAQTRARLRMHGYQWLETEPLPDLDTPADLDREISSGRIQAGRSSRT